MNIFSKLILTFLIFVSCLADASQLVKQEAKSLALAKYVVLGKVTSVSYNEKKFAGLMQVEVLETLKGIVRGKILTLPVDRNPISGFDLLLKKDDVAVFFIRELKDEKAYLIAPGASATFSREYFN